MLQCVAMCVRCIIKRLYVLRIVCCNVLQYVAVCCNVLQRVAVCCSVRTRYHKTALRTYFEQSVAMCCNVLQRVAVYVRGIIQRTLCSVFQCVSVCFSVLQCVAVCCSMLQCVANVAVHVAIHNMCTLLVCCSVFQCVAVCCSA